MKTTLLFLSVFLSVSLFGQNVYIPDAIFKAYLVGNPAINTNGDTEIQVSEANTYTGGIDCGYENISDLTGIEAFTALTTLRCYNNQLTSLDVSGCIALFTLRCGNNQLESLDVSSNTALTYLYCGNNQLTSLDVTNNTALNDLRCYNNQLTSLDVSNNTALEYLRCYNNQLTSLDVSNNTALEYLRCNDNQLTSLDVSSNTALEYLRCNDNQLECLNVKNGNNTAFENFFAHDNQNLTCIEVDDVNYSTDNWDWTMFDPQTSFSTDCNSSTDVITACGSYTWIDGNTYTSSNNTATYNIPNAAGCDSIITLDLTINNSSSSTDVMTACNSYMGPDGEVWTSSGYYPIALLVNSVGCDSVIGIDLTIISTPEPTIIQNGSTLACTNFASGYQWLDCDANYNPIIGETGMTFTSTQSGNYALEISFNGCSDTSECFSIDLSGIGELSNIPKQLIKIVDVLGRETPFKPNTPLLYIYDDGSIEKVFSVEY